MFLNKVTPPTKHSASFSELTDLKRSDFQHQRSLFSVSVMDAFLFPIREYIGR
ncbi:hypothetical protein I3760_03G041300 [Carya illinoinensis]|nr:hypothetical protein I3760_03G041300 [Carya illinoinensis]